MKCLRVCEIDHEENARMFNVYMRPWVLRASDADSAVVPVLQELGRSHLHAQVSSPFACVAKGGAKSSASARAESTTAQIAAPENSEKRRRLSRKRPPSDVVKDLPTSAKTSTSNKWAKSHADAWQWYINGNVVSETAARFIKNFWSHCSATCMPKGDSSECGSDGESHTET